MSIYNFVDLNFLNKVFNSMKGKLCKPKMMDCLSCNKNNLNESYCFDTSKCSVPRAIVNNGNILAWVDE